MTSLKARIQRIENLDGFKSEHQRMEYFEYAKLIDPEITYDQIRKPQDYISLLKSHLDPLPEGEP